MINGKEKEMQIFIKVLTQVLYYGIKLQKSYNFLEESGYKVLFLIGQLVTEIM